MFCSRGETGSGKSFIAQSMPGLLLDKYNDPDIPFDPEDAHRNPAVTFIQANCASLPRELADSLLFGAVKGSYTSRDTTGIGLLEAAGDGILFLDEVGDLPPATQGKLLLALENKEFCKLGSVETVKLKCRIIFGTNLDLQEATVVWDRTGGERGFRKDLLYRINSCSMSLPSIREPIRRDSSGTLLELSRDFIEREIAGRGEAFNLTLTTGAADLLRTALADGKYTWPGNFRDLRSLFERLKTKAMTVTSKAPPSFRNDTGGDSIMNNDEIINRYKSVVGDADPQKVAGQKASVLGRIGGTSVFGNILDTIRLSYDLIADSVAGKYKGVSAATIALLAGGLAYLALPIDLIPDLIPIAGWMDDVAVLTWIFAQCRTELSRYKKYRKTRLTHDDGSM